MSDDLLLEAALRDLGAHLDVPEPADPVRLTGAVRARLAGPPNRTGVLFGSPALLRVAAVIVAVLLAFAVLVTVSPPVRAGVLHLLRFAGIEFDSGSPPPNLPTVAPLPGERGVDLATAQRISRFPVAVPAALGAPQQVLVADGEPPRVVSLVYGGRIRIDEFDGTMDIAFYKKFIGTDGVEWAQVSGDEPAIWVDRPHEVVYVDRDGTEHTESARLSGRTLIWQRGDVTLRIEGDLTAQQALDIADSVS